MAKVRLWQMLLRMVVPKWIIPRDPVKAEKVRIGLAMAYGLLGWHVAGFMFYNHLREPPSDVEERKDYYQKLSSSGEVKIFRIHGLTVMDEDNQSEEQTIAKTEIEESPKDFHLSIS